MTASIEKNARFLSTSLVTCRNALLAWTKSYSASEIARRNDVQEDISNVIALLSEFETNGIFGRDYNYPDRKQLTVKGRGLAYASANQRTSKTKAEVILNQLLERIVETTTIKGFPRKVKKVWLFGSMVDDTKSDVGDIDFAIESEPNVDYNKTSVEDFDKRILKQFSNLIPESALSRDRYLDLVVLEKFIFGKKRHKLLAPNDVQTIKDLHTPCKLLFDADRGGIVNDPVLPHHPNSTKRGKNIYPKLTVPTLELSGELASARYLGDGYVPVNSFDTWRKFIRPENVYGHIVTNESGIKTMKEHFKLGKNATFDFDNVNGRDEFLIWFTDSHSSQEGPKGWVSIKRFPSIDRDDRCARDGSMSVNCSISFHGLGEADEFSQEHAFWIAVATSTMLAADVKLLHERAVVTGEDMVISAKTDVKVDTKTSRTLFALMSATPIGTLFSNVNRPADRISSTVEATHPDFPYFNLIERQGVAA